MQVEYVYASVTMCYLLLVNILLLFLYNKQTIMSGTKVNNILVHCHCLLKGAESIAKQLPTFIDR